MLKLERFQNRVVEAGHGPLTTEEWEGLLKSIGEMKFWPQFGKLPACPTPTTSPPQTPAGLVNSLSSAPKVQVANPQSTHDGKQSNISPEASLTTLNRECADRQTADAELTHTGRRLDAGSINACEGSNEEALQADPSNIANEESAMNALEAADEAMDTPADHSTNFGLSSFQIAGSVFDAEGNESAEVDMEFRGFLEDSGRSGTDVPDTVAPLALINPSNDNSSMSLPPHAPKADQPQAAPFSTVHPTSMMRLVDAGNSDAMNPDEALQMLQALQDRDLNILGSMIPGLAFSRQDMRQKLAQREQMLNLLIEGALDGSVRSARSYIDRRSAPD